jgi:outer membrane protein TolC
MFLLCVSVLACSAGAQEPAPPKGATLSAAVAYALQHNPDIRSAGLRIDSARAARRITGSYQNPTFGAAPGLPSQYSVSIPVDIGPPRTLRTRAAAYGYTAATFDSLDVRRQLVFSVRQAFFDLLLADSLQQLAVEQLDIFRQLLVSDSVRLQAGDIPAGNVAQSELQLAHADARLLSADANVRAARLTLQTLMGVPHPDTGFIVSGALYYLALDLHPQALLDTAYHIRPDLHAANVRIAQSATEKSLATALLFPTPTVDLVYQPAQPFTSGSHYAPGIGLQLPVWNWYSGERERARAGVALSQEAARKIQLQISADVVTAADSLATAQILAERYTHGLLAKATAVLAVTRFSYTAGAASLLDLLNAIGTYETIKTEFFNATHDYWVSAYALSRAVGEDLIP